jgi:hypothetical protein
MSHLPLCEREPSRFAFLGSTLDGGRQNSLAKAGTGSRA